MDDTKTPLLADQEDHSYSSIGGSATINPDRKTSESSIDIHTSASQEAGNVTKDDVNVKLYKRRWYMLVVFSLMSGTQSFVWNTWSPISTSSEVAFGWNDGVISLMANWGPITYFIGMPIFAWMLDMKGLRISSLLSMFFIAAGCGIRCITTTPPWVTWTMHIGQFLNGLGGPVGTGGPPSMSAAWFPPNERTTATALSTVIKFLMVACSFIVGPQLVPEVHTKNCTVDNLTMSSSDTLFEEFQLGDGCINGTNVTVPSVAKLREDIMFLMYIECAWSVGLFLLMLLYFPNKPPNPPCVSASFKRESFKEGLKDLLRRYQFWVLALVFGMAGGGSTAWSGVLKVNMKPTGISQDQAGWIGFYTFFVSCAAMMIVARLVDVFSRYMKWFISGVYFIAASFFAWFAVICTGLLPATLPTLYVSVISAQTALQTSIPIIFEMGCELTYPIGEGTTNGAMTLMNNAGALVFLLVLMIPNIGTVWMNWALVGAIVVSIPMLLMIRETHHRLDVDETKVVKD
ncbi:solute carrier family 49 member 4 homolog [Haliotis rubra]|uniref:solute carrier family 49 member 4 homolog n=1 Tax=Haliotis rubra TaxID=36100 RepID=UPI001EE5C84B|nr:solute carrier family 49 member 4 homolog [Haliotis rubra]